MGARASVVEGTGHLSIKVGCTCDLGEAELVRGMRR